jgi:hypothetical protein
MLSTLPARLRTIFALVATSTLLTACQTAGSGTKSVTCASIDYVYPSRKDTRPTIVANVANNEALRALGCPESSRPKR